MQTKKFTASAPGEQAGANSVRITVQRSAARNNPVALFFMRLLGHTTFDVRTVSVVYYAPTLRWAVVDEKGAPLNSAAATDIYGSDFGPTDPPWLIDMGLVGAADI